MIIDFRVRPEIEEFVSITNNPIFRSFVEGRGYELPRRTLGDLIDSMNANDIDYGVLEGRDIETTYQWKMDNDVVGRVARESAGRLIAFAGIDPHKGMAGVREIERCYHEWGMRGISLDPYMHKISPDHRLYYPLYTKCIELDIPVVFTSGWAYRMPGVIIDDAAPRHVDRVATDLPELKIVMSHGGYPWVREMVITAYRHRNVYFEWSGMELRPWADEYVKGANELVPDKALYASAFPFINLETAIARYRDLPFKPEVRPQVMGGNAARLLGITTPALPR